MPLRESIVSAVALGVLLAEPSATNGCVPAFCRCYSPEQLHVTPAAFVRGQRDRAERVVFGQVIRIDTLSATTWGVGYDRVSLHPIVARVAVHRVWRGPAVDTATVMFGATDAWSSCDVALLQGVSYVIFASRTEGGPLATRQCAGTVEARVAATTLAALGEGHAPRP